MPAAGHASEGSVDIQREHDALLSSAAANIIKVDEDAAVSEDVVMVSLRAR